MIELVYSSRANPEITFKEIDLLIENAKKYNERNEITGCLLCHNGQFLQILEGSEKKIKKIFSIIKEDTRHYDIKLLWESNIKKRTFNRWSMVYKQMKS